MCNVTHPFANRQELVKPLSGLAPADLATGLSLLESPNEHGLYHVDFRPVNHSFGGVSEPAIGAAFQRTEGIVRGPIHNVKEMFTINLARCSHPQFPGNRYAAYTAITMHLTE